MNTHDTQVNYWAVALNTTGTATAMTKSCVVHVQCLVLVVGDGEKT